MTGTQAVERPRTTRLKRFDPAQVGWRIGVGHQPKSGELWCPWDRTAGVIGPQGSGKTLDLLTPALLAAPGAALVTRLPEGKGPVPDASGRSDRVIFTSGTTGTPKGVVLGTGQIMASVGALAGALQPGPTDRYLSVLPLSQLLEQICGILLRHRISIQAAISQHVEPQIEALLAELTESLDSPFDPDLP